MPRGRKPGSIANDRVLTAEELRPITSYVQKALAAAKVSATNDQVITLIPKWIDYGKVDTWIAEYIKLMNPKA